MRTIERTIVGVFIMSVDGKLLLGYNHKGGVYQDQLVVPGGGVEHGEDLEAAARREMFEEVGVDLTGVPLRLIDQPAEGESPKTLPDGEVVLAKMTFYNYSATLPLNAADVTLRFDDDFKVAHWYTPQELVGKNMGPATRSVVQSLWPEHTF